MSLFVRTSAGGTGPDVFLRDLGVSILTSASWTELTESNSGGFTGGQFSPETLASSIDLYDAITNGDLEASTDGVSNNLPASEYSPSTPLSLAANSTIGGTDLSDGRLVLPNVPDPDALTNPFPRLGEIAYNSTDGYVEFYDGAIWQVIGSGSGSGGSGATELNELSDVDLQTTPPFVGSLLGYDGYKWVPVEGKTVYNKEIDELNNGDLYIGEALPGTAPSATGWRIQFVDFTKAGNTEDVSITWANGNALFDKIWDDRLTYAYS